MIRMTLIAAVASLATVAATNTALAQAGAPVRTLSAPEAVSASKAAEQKAAAPSSDKSAASKPARRYVAAPPFGW